MDATPVYPITQRLTRDIDPIRQGRQVWLAIVVPVIGSAIATGVFTFSGLYPQIAVGPAFALLAVLILLITLGIASSILTYHEAHDESFRLLLMTTLPNLAIVEGMRVGIYARTKPIRTAINSLLISFVVMPIIANFVLYAVNPFFGLESAIEITLFSVVGGLLAVIVMWGTTVLFADFAIKVGIAAALRLRSEGQFASTVVTFVIVATSEAPVLICTVLTLVDVGRGAITVFVALFSMVVTFFVMSLAGRPMVEQTIYRTLQRERRAAT